MLASAGQTGHLRSLALGLTLALGFWGASAVMDTGPAAADPQSPAAPPDTPPADGDLHVRYAEARLRLAELRLAHAEDRNRRTPGMLTETDVRRLRNRVELLRSQVAATKQRPHGNALELQRAAAKSMARIAQEEFEAAAAVHRRQPEAVSEQDLRQFEVRAEIARLRAALWDDPSFQRSPIDAMQMQIDQLADLVIEAADAVDAAPTINRR
jgi:hypothetical protein